ncbi:hypothetical protein SAMN05444277_103199 [Parafilimonas terrae]|uniref:Uncharacterized protein n=1 Tax=Parafilimonas terrae TaxID=1465490 RepID=A0A1I5UC44_9BACT|nr:hypothetical protein SAMN05444277_103199 [Parafilimonas terrae]
MLYRKIFNQLYLLSLIAFQAPHILKHKGTIIQSNTKNFDKENAADAQIICASVANKSKYFG